MQGKEPKGASEVNQATWTEEQVKLLNEYQQRGEFHPYTCGNSNCRRDYPDAVLIATAEGWICSHCPYRQNWAHWAPGITTKGTQ